MQLKFFFEPQRSWLNCPWPFYLLPMSNINANIAAEVNFTMRKGDTYDLPFEFTNADDTALSLVGATVLWQFRKKDREGELLQTVTHLVGGSIVSPNKFQPNFIVAMPAGTHYTDFQITFPSGKISTFFEGKVTVVQDVSNS